MNNVQYYLIDIPQIQSYLDSLDTKIPNRTKSYIDLFAWNIKDNLLTTLPNQNQFMLEIDNNKREISLMGKELSTHSRNYFCENEDTQDALYQNVVRSIETIKKQGLDGTAIREIKSAT